MSKKAVRKEFITLPLSEIHPYERNPRINGDAVEDVKESIRQCNNIDPIEIDENNVILSGHTRYKALSELEYTEAECLRVTGLTDAQKRKYRLLANKTGEKAKWDFELLPIELDGLDFEGYDFDFDLPEYTEINEEAPESFKEYGEDIETKHIEYRVKIVKSIYDALSDNGAFIIVEKVLGNTSEIDDLFVDEYYRIKSHNAYTQEQIQNKRKSLEGVLVPIMANWNENLLQTAGFKKIDCFYRCLNFAGWIAIK
jgi:hypothetical protein